jgi:hypothetical protein
LAKVDAAPERLHVEATQSMVMHITLLAGSSKPDLVDSPAGVFKMRAFLLTLLACLAGFGAGDDWTKVKALKTGAELRVFKKGSAQPVAAQMADLTDENLIVLIKKTETAIPRDQIDRIDARPSTASRVTKETTTKDGVGADGGQTSSMSTNYSVGNKPDFEMVYRRPPAMPKK